MNKRKLVSRRAWIKKAVLVTSSAVLYPFTNWFTASADTQTKATKASVRYQYHPKDGKMCGMCKHFIPPSGIAGHGMMGGMSPGMMKDGSCQVVQGKISPMGYCILYEPI